MMFSWLLSSCDDAMQCRLNNITQRRINTSMTSPFSPVRARVVSRREHTAPPAIPPSDQPPSKHGQHHKRNRERCRQEPEQAGNTTMCAWTRGASLGQARSCTNLTSSPPNSCPSPAAPAVCMIASLVGPSEMPLLFKNQPTQHRRQSEWVRASGTKPTWRNMISRNVRCASVAF